MDYTQFILTLIAVAMCGILFEVHYFITWLCNSFHVVLADDDDGGDESDTESQSWRKG